MRRFHYLFAPLALMLVLNLAACGNKGPLVRPSQADETELEDAAVEDEADADATDDADDAGDPEETEAEQDPLDDGGVDPVEVPPPPADPGNG